MSSSLDRFQVINNVDMEHPPGDMCDEDGMKPCLTLPDIVVLRQSSRDTGNMCNSEPNSRSSSFKKVEKPRHLSVKFETRRKSMPEHMEKLTRQDVDGTEIRQPIQRVRSFRLSPKGLVNRGDSFRRQSTKDSSSDAYVNELTRKASDGSVKCTNVKPAVSEAEVIYVSLVGASRVGKSALKNQFMTSDYTGDVEFVAAGEEARVPINLDDEESTVSFTDTEDAEDCELMATKDAILVVYAVNNRSSYNFAKDCLFDLRQNLGSKQVIILVANKADLVRTRTVSQSEGQKIAERYNCKYTETSLTLNMNIDELLVGVVKQIRLARSKRTAQGVEEPSGERPAAKAKPSGAKRFMKGLFRRFSKKKPKKKCENLYEA